MYVHGYIVVVACISLSILRGVRVNGIYLPTYLLYTHESLVESHLLVVRDVSKLDRKV